MRALPLVLIALTACKSANAEAPPERAKPAAKKTAAPTGRSAIGTNLNSIDLLNTGWAFLDAMKAGGDFVSCTDDRWDDGRRIEYRPDGWPKMLAADQRARMILPSHEGGAMVARWKGRGKVIIEGTTVPVSKVKNGDHRIDFVARPDSDLLLSILSSDAKDPVRDIQVYAKTNEARLDEIFHPLFLERLRPFSILRFMDWGRTNGSPLVKWSQRPLPSDRLQSSYRGVAYELMIDLANRVDADVWINVPHQADDAFVEALAKMLFEELDPKRKLYVEYSNEVWHDSPLFTQAAYARDRGLELKLSENPDVARLRFQARRSVEIFRVFEAVFPPKRLVRVIGSQLGNHYAHAELFAAPGVREHADAIAIAPYFGHELGSHQAAKEFADADVEALMQFLVEVSIPEALKAMKLSADWAKKNGVPLVAYEGGQHLAAEPSLVDDQAWNAKLDAANRHPAMKARYFDLLNGWKELGGREFLHFTFTSRMGKYGRFGALESLGQAPGEAPKYEALLEFIAEHPRGW